MAQKRKLIMLAAIGLFFVTVVTALFVMKSYVWPDVSTDSTAGPSNPSATPTTEPAADTPEFFSQLNPNFASEDFRHDAVIMEKPNGKIVSKDGVYFIESGPGTFWVWNRPWGIISRNFACEVVGRVAASSEGSWSLYLTTRETPPHGICVTLQGNATLEIGPNAFADPNAVEIHIPAFAHPAIKPGTEFNRLLIVLRGQELTVFVNGISVRAPIQIQQHVIPGVIGLSGSAGPNEASRVEFTSCNVWRLRN